MRHFQIRESAFRYFGGEAMHRFIVAMDRSRSNLPFRWASAESAESVTPMGFTVKRKA